MNVITKLSVVLFLGLLINLCFSGLSWGQCNEKDIRRAVKSGLSEYVFETASTKPFSSFKEPRKTIDAAFTVYAKEKYRVLNLCNGFTQTVQFVVLDPDKKEVYSGTGKGATFDFVAEKSGDYTIRFKFEETSNNSACVGFAIGYKL